MRLYLLKTALQDRRAEHSLWGLHEFREEPSGTQHSTHNLFRV